MPDTTGHLAVTSGFAELVCADPAWLRAEFDAIMTANFGVLPPPPPRLRPGSGGPRRPGRAPRTTAGVPDRIVPVAPEARGARRQRSPPLVGSPLCSVNGVQRTPR